MAADSSTESKTQFSPVEMMQQAEFYTLSKVAKPTVTLVGQGIMAGLFIGLAFVFYITVTTGSGNLGWGLHRFMGGIAFSVGLVMVIITGAELFTSTVLTAITHVNGQVGTRQLLLVWLKVYLGNTLGAVLLLVLIVGAGVYELAHGQWGLNALNIAQHKLHHTPLQAFSLGVLCNLMVCQAIWMTFSSKDILTKTVLVMFPVALFVSSGFEHCIANLFMVPLGIVLASHAPPEFWQAVGAEAAAYADLTWWNFLKNNLVLVTLGNIIGGAGLIGLGYWYIFQYPALREMARREESVHKVSEVAPREAIRRLKQTRLSQIMTVAPVTLLPELPIPIALQRLLKYDLTGAAVVDRNGSLVGLFLAHDISVELWRSEHTANPNLTVEQLMLKEFETLSPDGEVLAVAKIMKISIDELSESDVGEVDIDTLAMIERTSSREARQASLYPVISQERLVGVVSRFQVLQYLRPYYEKYGEEYNSGSFDAGD